MMTEQRAKNDIWFIICKSYIRIIAADPVNRQFGVLLTGERCACLLYIDPGKAGFDIMFSTIISNGFNIIATTRTDLAYMNVLFCRRCQQFAYTRQRDVMPAQQPVNRIKLLHVQPDIFKRDIIIIQ